MANSTTTTGMLRMIRCGLGEEQFGLDMDAVRGIQRIDILKPNPKGGLLAGWIPGRGQDTPVYSLGHKLEQPSQTGNPQARIVVLNPPAALPAEHPWALLVDRVSRVVQIPQTNVLPVPDILVNPTADYFQGIVRIGQELILLLSPAQLHPDAMTIRLSRASAELPDSVVRTHRDRQSTATDNGDAPAPGAMSRQDVFTLEEVARSGSPARAPRKMPGQAFSTPARRDTTAEMKRGRQIVVFTTPGAPVGGRGVSFALSISQVPEILNPVPLTRVPVAPPFVLGLINWRDRPVPVIDLDWRLGLRNALGGDTGRTRLLIARGRRPDALVGFLIHPSVRTLRLPIAHRASDRDLALDPRLTRGVIEMGNETVIIPDVQALLE